MKIVCASCAAKYSIADEKIAGKVFKIRCKKCSDVIVVRGDESAEEATRVAATTRAARAAGGDLFAQAETPSSAFGGGDADDGVIASAPSARVGDAYAAPTGQRNESSVLFSLANLQALGTSMPGARSASPASKTVRATAGLAIGEGSGLIDIRALTSAIGLAGSAAGRGPASSNGEAVDDLLSIGSGGSPFAPTLGAPILAPTRHASGNSGLILGIGFGAAAVVAAAALVVVVFLAKDADRPPLAVAALDAPAATIPVGVVPLVGAMPPPAVTASTEIVAPGRTADAADHGPAAPSSEDRESPSTEVRRPRAARRNENAAPIPQDRARGDARIVAAPTPTDAAPQRARADSMEAILEGIGGGNREQRPMPGASTEIALAEQPGRDQVRAALSAVQRATTACGGGQHGLAMTAITVTGSNGRVTHAVVSGHFAGTPVGSCVARAAREARFPRFTNPTFSVSFPFQF